MKYYIYIYILYYNSRKICRVESGRTAAGQTERKRGVPNIGKCLANHMSGKLIFNIVLQFSITKYKLFAFAIQIL